MNSKEYLKFLVEDIHSVVAATIDEHGQPVTCVIDMMYSDRNGLYFLTAKGKNFYKRLISNGYISLGNEGQRYDEPHGAFRSEKGQRDRFGYAAFVVLDKPVYERDLSD